MNRGPRHRRMGVAVLVAVAVVAAAGVAVIGGVRSFEAVSDRFGSPLVPLTADGMIIACTALRLAALSRGWRLPGSLLVTHLFIVGTVWLNVAAATGWSDAIAHALAPVAYAVLVELLAHMLRLQLRLTQPRRARVSTLTWATSPVITTRVWLHIARTGSDDAIAARALVQQLVRMASRLRVVCPNGRPLFGGARQARAAALQTIRDGLLTADDVAALLPDNQQRLTPSELLARIDRAALAGASVLPGSVQQGRTDETAPVHHEQPALVHHEHAAPVHAPAAEVDPVPVRDPGPDAPFPPATSGPSRSVRSGRSDEELVAELVEHSETHHDGQPLSGREARRVLGVGTGRARRLVNLAGWNHAVADEAPSVKTKPTESGQRPKDDDNADPLGLSVEMSDAR